MDFDNRSGMAIRISPDAVVLPANILRFYVHFSRPAEVGFDRRGLRLLDDQGRAVRDPFLILSQELWSVDGRRLTILMEPGRIKRGMGAGTVHDPALVVGRSYSLVVTAAGRAARHAFCVGEPVLEPLDETRWQVIPPNAGGFEAAVIRFDRVVDAALCEDEIAVLSPSGEILPTSIVLDPGMGTRGRLVPDRPWAAGAHRLLVSHRFEDVCGNRLGEALDHDARETGRPRSGILAFAVDEADRAAHRSFGRPLRPR